MKKCALSVRSSWSASSSTPAQPWRCGTPEAGGRLARSLARTYEKIREKVPGVGYMKIKWRKALRFIRYTTTVHDTHFPVELGRSTIVTQIIQTMFKMKLFANGA